MLVRAWRTNLSVTVYKQKNTGMTTCTVVTTALTHRATLNVRMSHISPQLIHQEMFLGLLLC